MKSRLFRAFLFAAVASAALVVRSAGAAQVEEARLAPSDPPGATCYHFPLITVCCDGGGCYIL